MASSTNCPSDNSAAVDQSTFWDSNGIHWDPHRIGWVVAGACAAATVAISLVNVLQHCLHYTNRPQQRQILRIIYMPPVYAVISFFSYRYFRDYTYYDLIETAYESVTLSAFLMLLIEFVASTASGNDVKNAIARKDKKALPIPLCFWRYRPTKAYFMYTVKWSVLQYVIVRPALSIVGIIAQRKGVLCESGSWSFKTAKAYITLFDAISISIALYGLFVFYGLTKDELVGKKPLAKFLSIKLIVMFTFYQSFVVSCIEIKDANATCVATAYWTEANIADGLNALAICIEMVLFSALMLWAYSYHDYIIPGEKKTWFILRPIWDSINLWDFVVEIFGSIRFFLCGSCGSRNKSASPPRLPVTDRYGHTRTKKNYEEAFGFGGGDYDTKYGNADEESGMRLRGTSSQENIHLGPYSSPYGAGDKGIPSAGTQVRSASPAASSRSTRTADSLDPLRTAHGRDRSSGGSVGMAF
ncbi:organic solute transporter Ostalpha-domain-containing protein [Cytidiella melzeri]|nr:organic solute transporter Ostalpha-domain-containing protein [Cytidiella melzeri]